MTTRVKKPKNIEEPLQQTSEEPLQEISEEALQEIFEEPLQAIARHLNEIRQSLSKIGTAWGGEDDVEPSKIVEKALSRVAAEIGDIPDKGVVLRLTLKNELSSAVDCSVQVIFEDFTEVSTDESTIPIPKEGFVPGFQTWPLASKKKTTIDFLFEPKLLADMQERLPGKAARLTVDVQILKTNKPLVTHFLNVVVPKPKEVLPIE